MDTTRSALQVGILVILAAVLFGLGYIFFTGSFHAQDIYTLQVEFTNAQGVSPGAYVNISGIKEGLVQSVRLDPATNKAILTLQLHKGVRIPTDSTVTISSSLLGGSADIEVIPPQGPLPASQTYYQPGATIPGTEGFSFAAIGGQAGGLLTQVTATTKKADGLIDEVLKTTKSLNKVLNDPQLRASLNGTVKNVNVASAHGVQLTDQGILLTKQLQSSLTADNALVGKSLKNVNATTEQFQDLAEENHAKLNNIVSNLNDTTTSLNQMTAQAQQTLAQKHTVENLTDTVANLKAATAKLDQIANDLQHLSGDPQVQGDLKTTLHNVAETSGEAKQLIGRLNGVLGGSHKRADTPQFLGTLDFNENLRSHYFRTDFDLYAPLSSTDLARIGLYDATGSNKLNLQYGRTLPYNRRLDVRAGVYDGKVGLGLDDNLFGKDSVSLDVYDPNRVHFDLKSRLRLNDTVYLLLGGQDLTRSPGATVGVELRR